MTSDVPEVPAATAVDPAAVLFAEPVADPGSRGVMKLVAMTAFVVAALTPFVADVAQDLRLQVWYSKLAGVTVAPSPDRRMSGIFIAGTERLTEQVRKTEQEEAKGEGPAEKHEPMGFVRKVIAVWHAAVEWVRTPSKKGDAANALYLVGTIFLGIFGILCRIYGVNRVMAMLSGAFGPDRFKKLVIDLFFLHGVERQIFPKTRTTAVKNGIVAQEQLSRVDLFDIIRVTVGLQGEGTVEVARESVTIEGRTAYTFCPSVTGSGGDYYFNLAHVTVRTVKVSADVILNAGSGKSAGRVRFDIFGFKAAAWQ